MAYAFYREITIDHTKVGSSDHTDFPLLFAGTYTWLKVAGSGGDVQNGSGYDIVFTDSTGATPLDFERVIWVSSSGVVEFHVRVPSVSHSTDTVIRIYYGDSGVSTDQQNKNGVWDSSYKGVYHFGDGTTLDVNDSTSNAANGTNSGASAAAGKVGGAASFDGSGSSDSIDLGTPSALDITGGLTLQLWIKKTIPDPGGRVFSKLTTSAYNGYEFFHSDGNHIRLQLGNSGSLYQSGDGPFMDGSAHVLYHGTFDGTNLRLFVDGALYSGPTAAGLGSSSAHAGIGAWIAFGGAYYGGLIDELRISNVARGADRILAEYNNQNDPATFYSVASPSSPTGVTGSTGGTIEVSGGTGGAFDFPAVVTGSTGGTVEATGGTGGLLGTPTYITGVDGGTIEISGGAGGGVDGGYVDQVLTGIFGGSILAVGGTTGAIFTSRDRCAIFIAGVDRSDWVELGMQRALQSGSRGTLSFTLNNRAGDYTPACGDEVIVYVGMDRFFGGVVDSTESTDESGTAALVTTRVQCVDYGALLDRRIIGTFTEILSEEAVQIQAYRMVNEHFADLGITYGGDHSIALIGATYINWMPGAQMLNKICDAAGYDWRIDSYKTLYVYPRDFGYQAAPFEIETNDGNWREMRVKRTQARRANRVGVRNTRDLKPLWTDTFTADGSVREFTPTRAILKDKPVVRLNGVLLNVTEMGVWTPGWQCYYLPGGFGVFFNVAPVGTVEVIYPSPLSYVVWVQDDADVAANGRWDHLEEARDFADIGAMQIYAEGLLARMLPEPVELTIETDRLGLEPGMLLTVDTTRPAVDASFVISSVQSEEMGRAKGPTPEPGGWFRHRVVASNEQTRRIKSDVDLINRITDLARAPKDRVTTLIGFGLAETIEGFENPGLTTGLKAPVRIAEKDGVLRDVSLYFRSVEASPSSLTESDINIDIFQNGVSVFAESTFMLFPAGATTVQRQFLFRDDPLVVTKGDVFTLEIITADSGAYDGVLQLTVLG